MNIIEMKIKPSISRYWEKNSDASFLLIDWCCKATPTYSLINGHPLCAKLCTCMQKERQTQVCMYLSLNSGGADAGKVDGLVFSGV